MPSRDSAVKRKNHGDQLDIVVIGSGLAPVLFLDCPHLDILEFCADMDALGFPVWLTPSSIYVFTGDAE